ncbi:HD domain-containing protein [Acidipila rosea]|uniref:Metal dependent phosphohydrolase n=1 Tax=Acidipila rosea TaxID=768535 RepID=A0A4R1LB40_9BACT|nr:HD domain-containing protein [Acidipila rosea]MBW4026807.1 HD domain-containing protein [Acidobacteriota bacterium]MBW4043386.1 HD domain-containing protein [Acidobacteriota bacterium]TCK73689.1 metal dependent phosphohydrolase [Acidipila rosea]
MSSATFRQQLPEYLRAQAKPVDKYGHQPRLYALTQQIGAGLSYDDDVVFAAAWLHDLGVFIGHRPEDPVELKSWNHVNYTCERAPELLKSFGFPEEKIAGVLEAIRHHQPQDDPKTMEAVILRDADILEQLGAIGILRAVAKIGRDTRYHTFSQAIDFLRSNLERLPAQIRLDSTRKLAAPRIELLSSFLTGAETESMNELH